MHRIACSTYAFLGKPLGEALMSIRDMGFEYAELVLHDSVEWGHMAPFEIKDDVKGAVALVRKAQEDSGVRIVAATASISEEISSKRGEFEGVCQMLRSLGIHLVTIPAGRFGERLEFFRLKDLRDLAAKNGIQLAVEAQSMVNWGDSLFIIPWEAASFAKSESGHRVTMDCGHLMHAGIRPEDWKVLLPFVAHVHIRDAKPGPKGNQVPFGEGNLDLRQLLESLQEARYDGYLCIEYVHGWEEGGDLDPARETVRLRDAMVTELRKMSGMPANPDEEATEDE